jgi:hypothetical protein
MYRGDANSFDMKVNQSNTTTFEILQNGKELRIYVDIEKIPLEKEDLICSICDDLLSFMREKCPEFHVQKHDLAITENGNSTSHEGRSYHVIIPVKTTQNIMKRLLINFVNDERYNKYIDYIDCSVYSNFRLFRVPNQIGFSKDGERITDNIHVPIFNVKDYGEYLIQNVSNLPRYYPKTLSTLTLEQKKRAAKMSGNINKYGLKVALDERLLASILTKARHTVEPSGDEILTLMQKLRQKGDISIRISRLLTELDEHFDKYNNFDEFRFDKQCLKSMLSSFL